MSHRIAHCAVSRALLVDRWAVRRVNRRVGYGTVRYGTVRQGYLRTLQTFVDILHSFRFVFILFYFITPKPNKRIKQNKSFSTFCIVPPFCRLHCVWHPNGIVSRPQSLFTERDSVWYLSLYECLSMGGPASPSLPPSLLSSLC